MYAIRSYYAQDAVLLFNSADQDYYIGFDDTDDAFKIGLGQEIGTSTKITLLSDGKLGIGTSTPLSELSVNGSLFLEGTDRYINFGSSVGTSSYGFRDSYNFV